MIEVENEYNEVKFIHSDKATKFCKISTLLLSDVVPVKRKVEILQNFVAFSEYMNFKGLSEKCISSAGLEFEFWHIHILPWPTYIQFPWPLIHTYITYLTSVAKGIV